MARFIWLIAFGCLSSVACGSGGDEGKERATPVAPDDPALTESEREASPGNGAPGFLVDDGADGVRYETRDGTSTRSFRCSNTCSAVCSSCLYEACMAQADDPGQCLRARDACNESCLFCPEGGQGEACYAPCLKGEPRCYTSLDLVMPDDVGRPDVTPDRGQSMGDQTTPDEGTSSSSSRGNSGRPED